MISARLLSRFSLVCYPRKKEEIERLYDSKRDEMFNTLTNAGISVFEFNGYRFQKTNEFTTSTLNKERLCLAMMSAGICESIQQEILLASCNESVRAPSLKLVKM